MPTYYFQDKDTGESLEEFMKISELDEFLRNHPNLMLLPSAPAVTGTMGKNNPMYKPKEKKNAN